MLLNIRNLVLLANFVILVSCANKTFHIPSIRANWFKANEFCNSLRMRLVIIKSQEENNAVAEFVRTTDKFSEEGCNFWIGGTDLVEEGVFIWTGTGEHVTYANWHENEPNDLNGQEDCLQLAYIPRHTWNWHWNDNVCAKQQFYFICEHVKFECVDVF